MSPLQTRNAAPELSAGCWTVASGTEAALASAPRVWKESGERVWGEEGQILWLETELCRSVAVAELCAFALRCEESLLGGHNPQVVG